MTHLGGGTRPEAPVERVSATAWTVPTDTPEGDGTLLWDATTIVVAEADAGGRRGLGYTYADEACAGLISGRLAPEVTGFDAMDVPGAWRAMVRAIRNLGRPGLASSAVSAVDTALWDLKAQLLDVSLVALLGAVRDSVAVYGSGGFTTYPDERLRDQLAGWAGEGIGRVKMKVGADPAADRRRVALAREAIGPEVELFVDANGAYTRPQAAAQAQAFADAGVSWFEEPVSSDDLAGLRLLRRDLPPGMAVAAGEYAYDPAGFRRLVDAEAVDVLQADATRCGGITGFLGAAALCEAASLPLSAHTAPAIHAAVACAARPAVHVEYFHDHARIEQRLFDGLPELRGGALAPDRSRPGLGLELRRADVEAFAV